MHRALAADERQRGDADVDPGGRRRSARCGRPAGRARSAMSSSDMILMREIDAGDAGARGMRVASARTPSTRKRTSSSPPTGSKWMSDAPCSTPWATSELTSLTTGASSADSRRSTTSGPSSADGLLDDHVVDLVQAPDERADVLVRGDRDADLEARDERDVVDRQDVARVAPSRPAACGRRGSRRGRPSSAWPRRRAAGSRRDMSTRKACEVDVVDPEALGDDARELVRRQDAAVDEDLARAPPGALASVIASSTDSRPA